MNIVSAEFKADPAWRDDAGRDWICKPHETVFDNPNELRIKREPNRHLAFGQGIRFCLGAPLARIEAQIAFTTLLRRSPDLRLENHPHSLRWRPSILLRGLASLPVKF